MKTRRAKFAMDCGFEHVRHSENVDARREGRVFVDERAHYVSEMNGVSDIGMLVEDGHDVAKVADIHGYGVEFDIGAAGGGSGAREIASASEE